MEESMAHPDGLMFKKVLVMGKAGSGKTTLAGSFPNWLFLDFDKNMRVLEGVPGVDKDRIASHRIPFSRGDDVVSMLKDILMCAKDKSGPFAPDGVFADVETVVVDSLHKMSDWMLFYIVKEVLKKNPLKDKPGFDGYALIKNVWSDVVELLKDIPMHVVCLSGVRTFEKEDEGTVEMQPMIDGSYKDMIAHEFGEVYYLERAMKGFGQNAVVEYRGYSNIYKNLSMLKTTTPGLPLSFLNPTYKRLYVDKVYT
jgi:hypothetical protein